MQEYKKQLEELRNSAYGQALTIYLEEEIEKMQDIHSIKTLKELQAKQDAEKIIKNLFKFLDFTPKKVNKTKYN